MVVIVYTLQQLFAPLILATRSRGAAMSMLTELGWTLDDKFQLDALAPLAPVQEQLAQLLEEIAAHEDGTKEIGDVIEEAIILGEAVYTAIEALQDLADGDVANLAAPLNNAVFWTDLALDLPEYLLLTYLETYLPLIYAVLAFGGAIGEEARNNGRPPRKIILWNELGNLFSDPAGQVADTYNWGGALEHVLLMKRLSDIVRATKLPVRQYPMPAALIADRSAPADGIALGVPLLKTALRKAGVQAAGTVDVLMAPVPASVGDPTGLLLTMQALGQANYTLDMNGGWRLTSGIDLDATGMLGLELQPGALTVPTEIPDGSAELRLTATPPDPFVLIGAAEGTRIELAQFAAGAEIAVENSRPEFLLDVELDRLQLVIAAGEGDSFIADVLGDLEFAIPMELGLTWSSTDGFRLTGGAGIDIEFPINRKIGPLEIYSARLRALAGTEGAEVLATTTGSLTIGPFLAVVGDIGFRLEVVPNDRETRGNNGALRIVPGFKAPSQIGLSVEAPGVSGGGYLDINQAEGRYNGILHIGLFGLEITAIGLISTRLPSGQEGWSLFLSISVVFPGGIQIGFGFSLTGIGGLAGVNRGIDIEALGEGVRTGQLDAVLFPDDPVANAPMIISALDTIFPAQQGQYVFGPIFQINWGVNNLLTIQLGLAIQLPSPLTISLLGSLHVKLAAEDAVVVSIRVDIAGTLWPTEGRLAIDSAITEGNIVGMTLAGDMAVRADFGSSKPNLLLSMGGFHPQFTPPEGVPMLVRMSLTIFNEEKLRIGVENYQAVTSNAFHFGVAAFFWAKAIGFTAEGRFEFDTLIIFRPFGLTASLGFQVSISAGSKELLQVRLRGTLKGPKPWFVTGIAEFKVLGAKKKFSVEMTLGRAIRQGPRELVQLFDEVLAALNEPGAWGDMPAEDAVLAAVQVSPPEEGGLVHPAGRIRVAQAVAPVGVKLERFGDARVPADQDYLSFGAVQLNGEAAIWETAEEWFSPAMFFDMSDDEKISAHSFEELEAGRVIGAVSPGFAEADAFPLGYETERIDPDAEAKFPPRDGEARGRQGPIHPRMTPELKSTLALDLVKATRASPFGIRTPAQVVRDPVAAEGRRVASFSEGLAAVRAGTRTGRKAVLQPAYELDLEEA